MASYFFISNANVCLAKIVRLIVTHCYKSPVIGSVLDPFRALYK